MKIGDLVRTDFEVISPEVRLSELGELSASKSYLVVYDQDRFLGILPSNQIKHLPDRPAAQNLDECLQFEINADLQEVTRSMQRQGTVYAAIFDQGDFVGVLSVHDIVSQILDCGAEFQGEQDRQGHSRDDLILRLENKVDEYRELVRVFTQYKHSVEKILKNNSDLLADVSHEIRNPLHIILSYAKQGVLKTDKNDDELIHRYFSRICDAGEKVLLLVDDLLDLSKLESGKTQYDCERCEFSELVETVLEEYQLILESKQITHYFKKPVEPCFTQVDRNRILQVIRNLVSNAYKFSPDESHIRLEIDVMERELYFSIIDSGFGFPKDEINELFSKYTRASHKDIKGTGLGLSIAFNIITDHKGRIYARPNPEGGSIFTFTLPLNNES